MCVCTNGKSGFSSPFSDNIDFCIFDIDYVPHEIGHQMGANHTYSFGEGLVCRTGRWHNSTWVVLGRIQ
jgi:hypothetical protein